MTDPDFNFSMALLDWFDQHGRHDLPWQVDNDPYAVWVSEIMLQQTQVKTVLNYFSPFMQRFPTVDALAQATWDEVAPYWAGLGYYARARNLHKAAAQVAAVGHFPNNLDGWMALSGIGRSTAGALMSLGLRQYGVIMDGNVKRVLSRFFALEGDSSKPAVIAQLWQYAEQLTPVPRNADYTQAIMDLGATICSPKKPLCLYCPMQRHCQAFAEQRVLEFPQKSAKKAIPTRHADVLIFQHNGAWLWQQRPNEGLWGGLWCLPLIEGATWNIDAFNAQPVGKISHSFTHFTWQLTAYVVPLAEAAMPENLRPLLLLAQQEQWLAPEHAQRLGVPSAMQKLLIQIGA